MYHYPILVAVNVLFHIELIITILTLIINWKTCEAGLRIIGGRNALKDEFPFVVQLEEQHTNIIKGVVKYWYHQYCTGAAITATWILTAAHCGEDVNELQKFARYNSHYPEHRGQLSRIVKVLNHPSYSFIQFGYETRMKYDIALYKTENIIVSSYGRISPIEYTSFIGHEAVVLGFGGTNGTPAEIPLQVLNGILVKCDVQEGHLNAMLCVMPRCGVLATVCGGDSGGPTVHASGIVGVNALASGDCDEYNHTVYPYLASDIISMVSPFIDWISSSIANKTIDIL